MGGFTFLIPALAGILPFLTFRLVWAAMARCQSGCEEFQSLLFGVCRFLTEDSEDGLLTVAPCLLDAFVFAWRRGMLDTFFASSPDLLAGVWVG